MEHKVNITNYRPLGENVLVTGDTIVKKGEDIVDVEEKLAINFIQRVVAIGDRVSNIKIGDTVDIDFNKMMDIAEYAVFLNGDVETLFLLIPTRYIRGVVELYKPED